MNRWVRLVGAALAVLVLSIGCQKKAVPTAESNDYASDREAVVAAIKSGQIQPDATGVAGLPTKWQYSSVNGQVYVGKDSVGGMLVVFPLMKASGRFECMLYGDNPIAAGTRSVQVGQRSLQLGGQSQGKWHQASILTPGS
jgi:hypothetical protein